MKLMGTFFLGPAKLRLKYEIWMDDTSIVNKTYFYLYLEKICLHRFNPEEFAVWACEKLAKPME